LARRRAVEPLTFHIPWKRLLLCDFLSGRDRRCRSGSRHQGASYPGKPLDVRELPRKRKTAAAVMTEPRASPSKHRDNGDNSTPGGRESEGRSLETGEPLELLSPMRPRVLGEQPRGWGRSESTRGAWGTAPRQLNEFWQNNTFQVWRNRNPCALMNGM
uniref:Uncharacterized protein n=1 Tax=Equus asinus TaxID=9793 RepID=A0A9L0J9A6_EQUAS